MTKLLFALIAMFLATSSTMAMGLDEKIDQLVAPASDAIASLIFYPIPMGGAEMPIIILWLLMGATIFTIATKFIGVWGFKQAIRVVRGDFSKEEISASGEVSPFQALATALSGTVGLGNIAGVAIAISIGGPGATLWMWIGAILGMASKFVECSLGVKFRRVNSDGEVSGGPMYYISHGLTKKKMRGLGRFLAIMFSIMCIGESFGGGNMFQIKQATTQIIAITGGANSFFASNAWVVGLIVAIIVGMIIIGGIKSIAKVTEKVVPFMCGLYVIAALVVIFANFTELPAAFNTIFTEAFAPRAVEGGIIGTIIMGLRRSVQSNEAGVGSAPIAYAAVQTKEPLSQGFVSILEPFIDTIILCSLTALVIIMTGMHTATGGMTGADLTSSAFESVIPFFPYVLAVAIILFALSTLISWSYYGQKSWNYLFGEGKKRTRTFQLIFCIFIVIGSSMNLQSVVDFTDAMMFAMAVPNMIGLFILLPDLLKDLDVYCKKYKIGAYSKLPVEIPVEEETPIIE